MALVIFRKRDRYGRLQHDTDELPEGVEVDDDGMRVIGNPIPLASAHRRAKQYHGLDDDRISQSWDRFLESNPRYGVGGEED